jgi:hypothetical protein
MRYEERMEDETRGWEMRYEERMEDEIRGCEMRYEERMEDERTFSSTSDCSADTNTPSFNSCTRLTEDLKPSNSPSFDLVHTPFEYFISHGQPTAVLWQVTRESAIESKK